MSDNSFRVVALHAVLIILLGMFAAGIPLVLVVAHDAYGQTASIPVSGDYRGWMMAHLEGLLNGLLMIAIAAVTRIRPLARSRERLLVAGLLTTGWGNTIASVLAPLLGVRGMIFDGHAGNDVVAGIFTVALIGAVVALAIAVRHLAAKPSA